MVVSGKTPLENTTVWYRNLAASELRILCLIVLYSVLSHNILGPMYLTRGLNISTISKVSILSTPHCILCCMESFMAVLLMMLEMQVLVWELDRQSNSIFRQLLPFFQCFDNEVSDKGLKRLNSEYNCLLD